MAQYVKKNHSDTIINARQQRFQRKSRSGKSVASDSSKYERRHGWGYAKRRALLND